MDHQKRQKYEIALEVLGKAPTRSSDQLEVAICLTQLSKYRDALHFYGQALGGFLEDRFWFRTSQPNWLVDTFILAKRPELYHQVQEEVEAYKRDPRGNSLVALYSYALVCLIAEEDEEAGSYVHGLLKKPKIKWTFAMGQTIQAIIAGEQSAFDAALDALLQAHRGMAKFGGLRETPEGFLCLPAMSLSKMALDRGMGLNAESEYLAKEYLEYIHVP
jgi:tetratricopeptide (TPR) repeat protein